MSLKYGGLFEGIGGFALAAQWAGFTPVWSNEIDPFCCKVLRKNFQHEIIEADIRECGKGRKYELRPVDIICGGDPCQPHSRAGLGKGQADDRFLWPEKFRIVRELRPTFVVNENVDGSLSNGVVDFKIDCLESEGYACQAYSIPAESVGALHQQERIWIVAHNTDKVDIDRASGHIQETQCKISERKLIPIIGEPVNLWFDDTNADAERFEEQYFSEKPDLRPERLSGYFGFGAYAHGNIPRHIIESGIIRMLDGLPQGMDYADRNKRIAALGNAIVPQVAFEIFKAIKEITNS